MAPCIIRTLDNQEANGLRKLRKPAIEKMRRDRINSSIEQLRLLLEKDLQKHQLPSKPEKADILEMTVSFLQQQMAQKHVTATSIQAYNDGYTTPACYLAAENPRDQLTRHFSGHPASYELPNTLTSKAPGQLSQSKTLWRPW
ncbi:transcription factor HES-5-like [Rana temporaria]|uniref:transcription factor HES-5-like n=1 Tax=Rana temporaria TaxID=8407 RepID=UPI001AAC9405|nr:transcription factor HES-5-like [Rana temporaria]